MFTNRNLDMRGVSSSINADISNCMEYCLHQLRKSGGPGERLDSPDFQDTLTSRLIASNSQPSEIFQTDQESFTDPYMIDWEQRWSDHGYTDINDAVIWSLATVDNPDLADIFRSHGTEPGKALYISYEMYSTDMFTLTDHLGVTDQIIGILSECDSVWLKTDGFRIAWSLLSPGFKNVSMESIRKAVTDERLTNMMKSCSPMIACLRYSGWEVTPEDIETIYTGVMRDYVNPAKDPADVQNYFGTFSYAASLSKNAQQFIDMISAIMRSTNRIDDEKTKDSLFFRVIIAFAADIPDHWITDLDVARSMNPDLYDDLSRFCDNIPPEAGMSSHHYIAFDEVADKIARIKKGSTRNPLSPFPPAPPRIHLHSGASLRD